MKRRNTTHFENSKPTSQNVMKKKGKKKDEVTKLMEGQKSMGSFYYQTREGEKAIMTRSERRRRMTVDIKPQRPSTREAKNAPERKAKPKMNPLKIPTTVKPMQQESKKEVSLQNAIMQLEEGASKVSKENIQTKDCSHEILSFPECASFLKVNDKITFCKMSQNRGVVLMEGGAVRQWNMNEAGAFSTFIVLKGKLAVDVRSEKGIECFEVGPLSFVSLKPFSSYRLRNSTISKTVLVMVGFNIPRTKK